MIKMYRDTGSVTFIMKKRIILRKTQKSIITEGETQFTGMFLVDLKSIYLNIYLPFIHSNVQIFS